MNKNSYNDLLDVIPTENHYKPNTGGSLLIPDGIPSDLDVIPTENTYYPNTEPAKEESAQTEEIIDVIVAEQEYNKELNQEPNEESNKSSETGDKSYKQRTTQNNKPNRTIIVVCLVVLLIVSIIAYKHYHKS